MENKQNKKKDKFAFERNEGNKFTDNVVDNQFSFTIVRPKNQTERKIEEPTDELLQKIRKQIEYYFGDVNMQNDKFLIEQTKLDDGWIPMFTMLKFNKLASMSTDVDVISKALQSSNLLEISEDKKKIRRSPRHSLPVFNEEYKKDQCARTVYIKGFPFEGTSRENLEEFFNSYEPYEKITLRKYMDTKNKKLTFKGSIYVQFKTLENAQAFMARNSIKYGDTVLLKMWSVDYLEMKKQGREEMYRKKLYRRKKQQMEKLEKRNNLFPKGTVIHLSEIKGYVSKHNIKKSFPEVLQANIAYVDFKKGMTEAWIRFKDENSAKESLEKLKSGKIMITNHDVSCRLLEGDKEMNYFAKAEESIRKAKMSKEGYIKKGRKGRGRKRRATYAEEQIPVKRQTMNQGTKSNAVGKESAM